MINVIGGAMDNALGAPGATFISLLRNVQSFASLDDDVLKKISETAEYKNVARGEVLITEGEPARNLYIVLKGRFVVLVGDSPIAEISMGEPIGELAFFAGGKRTASVVAARNSAVMRLSREAYDTLAQKTPELSNGILKALSERLARTISDRPELRPKAGKICAVFPGGDRPLDPAFVSHLKGSLENAQNWTVLDESALPHSVDTTESVSRWLEEQEARLGNLVLLCSDPSAHKVWRGIAADNSDTILIALDMAEEAHTVSELERELFDASLRTNVQLVLYRAEKTMPTRGTAYWLEDRDAALHHHVALNAPEDFARLSRFIKGEALGLVLCGGGSLGTAHLGAIHALQERGYNFDFVGGTSVGSAMSAALAIGLKPSDVMDLCEDIFIKSKAMSRLTVPRHSLLDHHTLDSALARHYQGFDVEDAPLNFFSVATSLTHNDTLVLRRGPLWEAVRASSSLPGIFPPFIREDGEVLIDGGLLDNVPVTVMRDLKAGPNLVLNFLEPKPWRVKANYADLPTRGQAVAGLIRKPTRGKARHPSVMSTLSRAMVVNARKLLRQTEIGEDVLLNLSTLRGMSFMDWKRGRELFDFAYKQMSDAIDQVDLSGPNGRVDGLRHAANAINLAAQIKSEPQSEKSG